MDGANDMPRKPDLSLIGQVYNNLKVDKLTDKYNSYNRRLYECTCLLCGKKRLATKQNLQRNEIKDCGSHWSYNDITNKRLENCEYYMSLTRKAVQKVDVRYGIVNAIVKMNVMYYMTIW